jgi:hypothetical protein
LEFFALPIAFFLETVAERCSVLDGERGALSEIGQRWMDGVAEEDDAALAPMPEWGESMKRPAAPLRCGFHQ